MATKRVLLWALCVAWMAVAGACILLWAGSYHRGVSATLVHRDGQGAYALRIARGLLTIGYYYDSGGPAPRTQVKLFSLKAMDDFVEAAERAGFPAQRLWRDRPSFSRERDTLVTRSGRTITVDNLTIPMWLLLAVLIVCGGVPMLVGRYRARRRSRQHGTSSP
ncbi:MAG: hypothetical protein ACP5HU_12735 [Phycisphaerae bacterium]